MSAGRSLVTVVGTQNQVDVSLPAGAPIADYADMLADLVGEHTADEALPPAWSLATAIGPPLPMAGSLSDAGIADGEVLYLRDALAGEGEAPVVRSVWEIVSAAGQDERGRWGRVARARAAVLGGVAWLVAGLAYLGFGGHGTLAAGLSACVLGLGCAVVARLLASHPRVLTRPQRVLLACAAVPLLTLTSVLSLGDDPSGGWLLMYAVAGLLIGLVIALAAAPDVVVAGLAVLAVFAVAIAGTVLALHANAAEAAATVVTVGTLFLAVTPRTAGALTAISWLRMSSATVEPAADHDQVTAGLGRARRVLLVLNAVTAAAVAVALPVLVAAGGWFGLALAAAGATALLLQSSALTRTAEAVGPLIAGLTGVLALVIGLGRWEATRPVVLPLVLVGGISAIGAAVPMLLWRAEAGKERPQWTSRLLTVAQIALPPLLLGVWGLFGALLDVSRTG